MSATLSNTKDLAGFLGNASIYTNNFRPVELNEYVKFDSTVMMVDSKLGNEEGLKHQRFIKHKVRAVLVALNLKCYIAHP